MPGPQRRIRISISRSTDNSQACEQRVPSDFPQELVDYIIDLVRTDYETVLTCTLVSRAWLPRSRFQMFREKVAKIRAKRLSFLAEILSSKHESISSFLSMLIIQVPDASQVNLLSDILLILSRPQAITALAAAGFAPHSLTPMLKSSLLSFPLTNLTLAGCNSMLSPIAGDIDTLDELAELICGFPALEQFSAVNLFLALCPQIKAEAETDFPAPLCTFVPPSSLRVLCLDVAPWGPISWWLTTLEDEHFPQIHTLDVKLISQDWKKSCKVLGILLRRLGSALRSLTLTVCRWSVERVLDHLFEDVDLSFNTRLSRFTLNGDFGYPTKIAPLLPTILAQIQSPIKELTFNFSLMGNKYWLDSEDANMAKKITLALEAPQFGELKKLSLLGFKALPNIRRVFKTFDDRGILVFLDNLQEET